MTTPTPTSTIIKQLCEKQLGTLAHRGNCTRAHPLPSNKTVALIIDELKTLLFPMHYGGADFASNRVEIDMASTLERIKPTIKEQILRGLCFECRVKNEKADCDCEKQADGITDIFTSSLPRVKDLLNTDVEAAFEGDPAAPYKDEAIFCYPGITAMIHYRLAHELYKQNVPLIPRMITEQAHSDTGIDIHPGAKIGEHFFIDHGTGVVIGETGVIGNHVTLYQGVTLGAKSFPKDENGNPIKGIDRHPIVEDNVIIYSEATILGRITIGRGSMIGGNVWLTHSIPPGSRVTQASASELKFGDGGGI